MTAVLLAINNYGHVMIYYNLENRFLEYIPVSGLACERI